MNVSCLASVPFENLDKLPHVSGIYFVLDSCDNVIYVGKAFNLNTRWRSHHIFTKALSADAHKVAYEEHSLEVLSALEAQLIWELNPTLNRQRSKYLSNRPSSGIVIQLAEARIRAGLSQNELARAVNVSSQQIQKIEYGKVQSIPNETLDRLCKALGCGVGDILVYVPDET